jgi:hypothetical protein
MKYVVKKTAMYGSSTYGPYISYQEALEALEELENNTFSECFFSVENLRSEERKSQNKYPTEHPTRVEGFDTSNYTKI